MENNNAPAQRNFRTEFDSVNEKYKDFVKNILPNLWDKIGRYFNVAELNCIGIKCMFIDMCGAGMPAIMVELIINITSDNQINILFRKIINRDLFVELEFTHNPDLESFEKECLLCYLDVGIENKERYIFYLRLSIAISNENTIALGFMSYLKQLPNADLIRVDFMKKPDISKFESECIKILDSQKTELESKFWLK